MPAPVLAAALAALALALLALVPAAGRAAGRACYRINRDAYCRAQAEWAAYRGDKPHIPTDVPADRLTG